MERYAQRRRVPWGAFVLVALTLHVGVLGLGLCFVAPADGDAEGQQVFWGGLSVDVVSLSTVKQKDLWPLEKPRKPDLRRSESRLQRLLQTRAKRFADGLENAGRGPSAVKPEGPP